MNKAFGRDGAGANHSIHNTMIYAYVAHMNRKYVNRCDEENLNEITLGAIATENCASVHILFLVIQPFPYGNFET